MSESNNTSVENNDTTLRTDDVYIYKGGQINETDRDKMKHVRIDESVCIIDDKTFANCTNLQTVEFSKNHDSMTKAIGKESFSGCENLLSINMQYTEIETIGNDAFYECSKLSTIQFPASVRKIGRGCFCECVGLKVIDLSHMKDLEAIEEYAFSCCSELTTINLPPTLSCIGEKSFSWCEALQTVDLRSTCVNEIKKEAFDYCRNLANVSFPTTIRYIGEESFYNCEELTSLDLRTTCIERLDDYAFYECSNLKTIKFPATLKSIGCGCFENCIKLESLNLQETSIEKIGERAFTQCSNLTTIAGISSDRQEELQENMDDKTFLSADMNLPTSLVDIGEDSFWLCPKLTKKIDFTCIRYECDINRGGRRFLQRHHHQKNDDEDTANQYVGKVYFSSLWPLILYRAMNDMELPQHRICTIEDALWLCINGNPLQRRASVVYYLMVHGVIADLQS